MSQKNTNAKIKILNTAKELFADKGYDGTSIEQITRKAGVTKSLVYYHFNKKSDILNELVKQLLDELREVICSNPNHKEKRYQELVHNNEEIIRIIFIESLKRAVDKPIVFSILETLLEYENKDRVTDERIIAEFFTNIVPGLSYVCFKSSMSKYFMIDEDHLAKNYMKIMKITHGAYHDTLSK